MFIVSIDLDAYESVPPRQLKAMLRALRFADREGLVHATLTTLAMPGLSRSSMHRELHALEAEGHVDRHQHLWRIGRRFRHVVKPAGGVPTAETPPVPQAGTPDSHARAVKVFSSSESQSPKGEQPSQQDEIPDGWQEAAAAERRLAGLPDVDYRVEWRKLVAYSEGRPVTIWRWRGWILKARAAENSPHGVVNPAKGIACDTLPGGSDERQQRQARDWAKSGFWMKSGIWGPAPDQPGCTLPPDLVAWCLAERTRSAA